MLGSVSGAAVGRSFRCC